MIKFNKKDLKHDFADPMSDFAEKLKTKKKRNIPRLIWEKYEHPYKVDAPKRPQEESWGEEDDGDQAVQQLLLTPFGAMPVNDSNNPDKLFNLYIVHTNFPISQPIMDVTFDVPGIESVDVFTKYRMRIGIGKAFKEGEVRTNLAQAIQEKYGIKNT